MFESQTMAWPAHAPGDAGTLSGSAPAKPIRTLVLALAGALLFLIFGQITRAQAASITVDGTTCTLVNAITAANSDTATGGCTAGSGADTIILAPNATHTLTTFNNTSSDTIRNGLPQITSDITIDGNNATIIRPVATSTGFRIFYVAATGALTLNNLTLQGGSIQGRGAGIANLGGTVIVNNVKLVSNASKLTTGSGGGGGIYSSGGTVTLTNSLIQGSMGGAINVAGGELTLTSSTVFSNEDSGEGTSGGIFIAGTLVTLTNSTVTANITKNTTASANKGGGITVSTNGTLTLNNSTVTGNSSLYSGGGIRLEGATSSITLLRSLIAGNTATSGSHELFNNSGTVTANNDNLFGHSGRTIAQALSGFTPGATDLTATSDGTIPTALSGILNPTPANNGGATLTHALVDGSPAIDAAGATGPATDQRGITRPQGSAFDIGAFEVEQVTNSAPVAVNDSYTTNQDTQLIVPSPTVLDNDSDGDNDPLTAILVTNATHGAVTLNTNGSFSYTPNGGFTGSDSFTYKANDGTADSNAASVTITVLDTNDAPIANDDSYSTGEDTPLTVAAPGLLGNDTDAESNPLTAALVSTGAHGNVTVNPDGAFTYTPATNFCGADSFSYKANDSQADSNVAMVLLTVNCVNDAPLAAVDGYTTAEDVPLTVIAPGLLANDSDVENDPLTASLVSGPSHGTLALNADGSFSYTPPANFSGSDSFTYKSNDGVADSAVATVDLTITPVNDAPTAVADSYSTNQATPLTSAAPGVLGNDSDLDGNSLTAAVVDLPMHGVLTLNPDGSFTYTPDANYNGADSFTYLANDGAANSNVATVSLTINPINNAVGSCGGFTVVQTAGGGYTAPGWSGNIIVGTNGWNIIFGSNGADLILGRGGPDDIFGLRGNDIICGGDGIDIIVGGEGADLLFGDEHPDWLIGGSGNDTLRGGNGWDDLEGNDGQDTLYGEEGFDVLLGGDQNDILDGGDGPDYLEGGSGLDNLSGGTGPDALYGGHDNDTLAGNDGEDLLYGNHGNDALNGGNDSDFCFGGPGSDTITQCEGASAAAAEDDTAVDKSGEADPTKRNDDNGANAIDRRFNQIFLPMVGN